MNILQVAIFLVLFLGTMNSVSLSGSIKLYVLLALMVLALLYMQVFKYFCNDVTDDGLLRMLRVIKKDLKPARRKDGDSEDGSDDEDDDLLDIEEAEESDEADILDSGESGAMIDDSEAAARAEASDDSGEDDDSDEDMDDEAMFRMDSYLAKMFQERKNQAGGDTAHAQLVLFKLRVLSLLEIYLHENPGNIQPLLHER